MGSIGAQLKEIRLKKGLSLEEAHAKTKLNVTILKAVEEDNLAQISPVYIKGFIKIYCEFLGVDPQDYSPDARPVQPQAIAPKAKEQPEVRPAAAAPRIPRVRFQLDKRVWIAIGVAVLAGLVFLSFKGLHKAGAKVKESPKQEAPVRKKTAATVSSKKTTQKSLPSYQAPGVKKAVTVSQPKARPAPLESKPVSTSAVAVPKSESSSGIRLGIHANEDCWVQLKLDGKAVFQSVLKKGRYEVWQAKDKMELSLGNVGAVELELNGKMLQSLGRKGQSLKNIVITKEGLKVER